MNVLSDWLSRRVFDVVHRHFLIYNTCWEDPRIDREAMELGPDDAVVLITSAGCNALDYLLDEPAAVHAVDVNPRQNALLELKLAGIRTLEFEDFFEIFGRGRHRAFGSLYHDRLRPQLAPEARRFWDRHKHFFDSTGPSFYRFGTCGRVSRLVVRYLQTRGVLHHVRALFDCATVAEQSACFHKHVEPKLWGAGLRWFLEREVVLALLGVPRAQRLHLEGGSPAGIADFMRHCVTAVFSELPLRENYFWRVYVFGEYSTECCPSYLKPANFLRLRSGLLDRLQHHTCTLADFLQRHPGRFSRFVLLDHMDWLWRDAPEVLRLEWQRMIDASTANARFLWRSAGTTSDFVDRLPIATRGDWCELRDLIQYRREQAEAGHARDRVHTYATFHIAERAA
jgi:S-adenosylmethionine-diacylglycerol 3-amino-3-carboxypropyl transferase